MNVVIMAGGGGSRLWPLSRHNRPKQFLDLGSGKTLLEEAYNRARALTDPANIYVATTSHYASDVKKLLPQVAENNLMYEPERRDTGPAFAVAAVTLENRGEGDTPTIFMWSDHVFTQEKELLTDLKKIPQLLADHPDSVVIAGHIPVYPETGLGYFEVGQKITGYNDVYRVVAFKEKPDKATAQKYLDSGKFFWNMAYISVRPTYLLRELAQHAPPLMENIAACRAAIAQGDTNAFNAAYALCQPISIDYVLLEKTANIIAVTGDYGWSDVGNWGAVKDVFGVAGDHMPKGHHVHVDSDNNYIYNTTDKVVSMIGLKDVIAVITDDAILLTHKDTTHKVKDVVQQLQTAGRNKNI